MPTTTHNEDSNHTPAQAAAELDTPAQADASNAELSPQDIFLKQNERIEVLLEKNELFEQNVARLESANKRLQQEKKEINEATEESQRQSNKRIAVLERTLQIKNEDNEKLQKRLDEKNTDLQRTVQQLRNTYTTLLVGLTAGCCAMLLILLSTSQKNVGEKTQENMASIASLATGAVAAFAYKVISSRRAPKENHIQKQ